VFTQGYFAFVSLGLAQGYGYYLGHSPEVNGSGMAINQVKVKLANKEENEDDLNTCRT
jgi:hypothetical protein